MTDPQTVPAPSGTQHSISYGEQHVTVTEVGAALREYTVGGRDVVVPFAADEVNPVFNGAVLLPWPNRLRDGRYEADGVSYSLPVTEPARGTALHGLAAWERWSLVDRTDVSVTLGLDVVPQPGYPFQLTAQITYALSDGGLTVTLTTTNVGTGTAPYGAGFHPWLSTGGADLDDCTVRLDAATRVTTDDRLLPVGTEPVAGAFDMREPVSMAGRDLDDAFIDVLRDDDGLAWIRLTGTDGRTAALWMDGSMDVWQACSGDHVGEGYRRMGLAAEPMTCYADAFVTGDRLVRLAPGDTHRARWGVALVGERRA
ncbi:aldose 1-epimerase family protein [Myceligenerans indicum]|uniref:Aldose 1-epimerase family protein n=1 Tax=Myceligenerans indicum TaxID=2593663 RepID=A0ABS1LF84_9MICO|nr:aldose 1-epimerase family protein [Myceligenerans indicum]MBL0884896.1 aldose 1-epimerase family protein [Myceligenerans indicum]